MLYLRLDLFNADDLRHALTWFDRALALRPVFLEALSARALFFNGWVSLRMHSNRLTQS